MTAQLFPRRVYRRPEAKLRNSEFPGTLPFVANLDLQFDNPVTILVGENASGNY